MVAVYLIEELVSNSAENAAILDGLDWVIVPILNQDGYVHAHTFVSLKH